MPILIERPAEIVASGHPPKTIHEYVGRVNTGTEPVSIAHMRAPGGWAEPGQTPDFDEYTVVIRGFVRVEHREGSFDVQAGQAILARKGEWIRYSTPGTEGAEYVAVCIPAFSPHTVNRD